MAATTQRALLEELRGQSTCSVPEAGRLLGIGKQLAFDEAHRYLDTDGAAGLPCFKFGRLLKVPVPKLLAMLGEQSEVTIS